VGKHRESLATRSVVEAASAGPPASALLAETAVSGIAEAGRSNPVASSVENLHAASVDCSPAEWQKTAGQPARAASGKWCLSRARPTASEQVAEVSVTALESVDVLYYRALLTAPRCQAMEGTFLQSYCLTEPDPAS
tara:strand:+ start:258112 stop:258522 length:411 start_codon:yes stop_codon:yes gene_type:complete